MSDFNYKQRPATDAYRDNWERIWGRRAEKKHGLERADFDVSGVPVYIDHDAPDGFHLAFLAAPAGVAAKIADVNEELARQLL